MPSSMHSGEARINTRAVYFPCKCIIVNFRGAYIVKFC